MKTKNIATFFAILAAALYAINIPVSKVLLQFVQPTMMAAFLYLGAGVGLCFYGVCRRKTEEKLTGSEMRYTVGMVVLDIAAPILLMLGLRYTDSANASLLNNFEIVATSLIAYFLFREKLSKRLIAAIILVTAASITLSFEGMGSFRFHTGSLLILGAAKTSAYYSVAPFLGMLFGVLFLRERPGLQFFLGLAIMIGATVLIVKETISLQHTHKHSHTHSHEHAHGDLIHSHEHCHIHTHIHGEDETAHGHTHHTIEGHNHSHTH